MTSVSDIFYGAGIPLLPANVSIPNVNSKFWFVNSGGSAAGFGTSPQDPLQSMQAAIDRAGDYDTIFLMTGSYDENIVVTQDYLTIIGAQISSYGKPDWVASTGVALTVQGQGFVARNIRFSAEADADVVIQNGNGFEYSNCVFDADGSGATKASLRLVGGVGDDSYSASEGLISNNYFRGVGTSIGIAMQWALAADGGEGTSDNQIIGNRFIDNGVDLKSLTNINGGGVDIYLRYVIARNQFLTGGAGYVYADMNQGGAGDLAANSALISGNWFADDAFDIAQFAIDGQPKVFFSGNYDAAGLINGSTFNN